MIWLGFVIALATGAGVAARRRWAAGSERVARGLLNGTLYVLLPFISFFNIAHLRLTAAVGVGVVLAYVVLAATGVVAWLLARRLGLDRPRAGALICVSVLANTGYLGLPLAVALLGVHRLPAAIAYDQLVSGPMLLLAGFGIGAAFGGDAGSGRRQRLRAFLVRNPPLLAVAGGLVAGPAFAPQALVDVSQVAVIALAPAGFFVVGVTLAAESAQAGSGLLRRPDRTVATALGLRLGLAPAMFLGLAALAGRVPDAYRLQAAMPSGINSLLVAHAYGIDARLVAAAIGWSTAVVLVVALALGA